MVVRTPSLAYNVILRRPLLNDIRAMICLGYFLMKFSTSNGVGQVKGDQRKARNYYISSTKKKDKEETFTITK